MKIPEEICRDVPVPVCKTVPTKSPFIKSVKECSRCEEYDEVVVDIEYDKKCNRFEKESCHTEYVEKCKYEPKETCEVVFEEDCQGWFYFILFNCPLRKLPCFE